MLVAIERRRGKWSSHSNAAPELGRTLLNSCDFDDVGKWKHFRSHHVEVVPVRCVSRVLECLEALMFPREILRIISMSYRTRAVR